MSLPTDRTPTVDEALSQRDVTIAFTPGQLLMLVIGIWILLRIVRGLRG